MAHGVPVASCDNTAWWFHCWEFMLLISRGISFGLRSFTLFSVGNMNEWMNEWINDWIGQTCIWAGSRCRAEPAIVSTWTPSLTKIQRRLPWKRRRRLSRHSTSCRRVWSTCALYPWSRDSTIARILTELGWYSTSQTTWPPAARNNAVSAKRTQIATSPWVRDYVTLV